MFLIHFFIEHDIMKTIFLLSLLLLFAGCQNRKQEKSQKRKQPEIKVQNEKPVTTSHTKDTLPLIDYDTTKWTEVKRLDNSILLDLRYATTNNFVNRQLYDCPRCFLRPYVAKALLKAQNILRKKGLQLLLFDCYRPRPIQKALWKIKPDKNYVTPPWKGSMHNRGMAVDLTIADENGVALDMGTPFDFFGKKAWYDYKNLPGKVIQNRKLLRETMLMAGFKPIRTEWWHFSYKHKTAPLDDMMWKCIE